MYYHYFPESFIALREEIDHHPDLLTILKLQPDSDLYIHLAEIAAYCNVALDGYYTQAEIIKIADILVRELRAKRVAIILPFGVS
jgi:hypothetical protein